VTPNIAALPAHQIGFMDPKRMLPGPYWLSIIALAFCWLSAMTRTSCWLPFANLTTAFHVVADILSPLDVAE